MDVSLRVRSHTLIEKFGQLSISKRAVLIGASPLILVNAIAALALGALVCAAEELFISPLRIFNPKLAKKWSLVQKINFLVKENYLKKSSQSDLEEPLIELTPFTQEVVSHEEEPQTLDDITSLLQEDDEYDGPEPHV